jgi:uncharacterized protein YjdB
VTNTATAVGRAITFRSADAAIAGVDVNGLITAIAQGAGRVIVEAGDGAIPLPSPWVSPGLGLRTAARADTALGQVVSPA